MRRTLLKDKDSRVAQMKQHTETVAKAILGDLSGDAIFQQYLAIKGKVHRYSLRNRILQMWQAPDSALVASRTAFAAMAKAQGHQPVERVSVKGKTWEEYITIRGGGHAVWIWGSPRPTTYLVKVIDEQGNVSDEPRTCNRFNVVDTYCVEDVRYADTGEPFVMPSFVVEVEDLNLYEAALAFAAHKGITVEEEGLGGAAGVSKGGTIATQKGTTWQAKLPTLLHEIAHELLHPLQERSDLTREVMEAEAEATCAVILHHFGHGIGPQAAYLRNWKASEKDVIASMDRISKAAEEVVDFIEKGSQSHEDATGDADTPEVDLRPTELAQAV